MRRILLALFALAFASTAQAQNYAATQGTGTTFGSKLVSAVNYPQIVFCDPATPAQCVAVNSSGQLSITAASGAVASGAYAAGSLAAGAGVDGWDLTQGAKADAAWVSGSGSVVAILKNIAGGVAGAIPAGTNLLGKVGIDQTTPGTTNGVQVNAALPAGTNSIGNVGSDPSSGKATPTSAFLALPATATTQIIALSGTKVTYVTSYRFMAGGTVNVTFKYGTGSNCGTGTTTLEGPWPLTAQAGMTAGSGLGAILIVPAGQALCVTTDASVTGGVSLSYQQF